ncbi:MAG: hypothetical protein EBQ92_10715 [Proteobacteria bacterium]|nr:hypothetical protein [Pseudomonadota bacterium]
MKRTILSLFMVLSGLGFSHQNAHYISSIQLQVTEPNTALTKRSQDLVVKAFSRSMEMVPVLKDRPLRTETSGPNIVFTLTSNTDLQTPVQEILAQMVEDLNGRVLARGKSSFYRAALSQPLGGYLEVVMDDANQRIIAISAESVPLRDILNEIRNQSGSMSYLISGDCAEKLVDWSFVTVAPEQPKEIDAVMNDLAFLFNLKCDKKNGSYIFSGNCLNQPRNSRNKPGRAGFHRALENPLETEVFFPTSLPQPGRF